MASVDVKVRTLGAGRASRRFLMASQAVEEELQKGLEELGDVSELIFAAHALRRSGRMARGVVARAFGSKVIVRVDAKDPKSGFDYVGVTRFGHRVSIIRPKRAKALRIPLAGGVIFRRSSRGFHPAGDWAEQAIPQIEREAQSVATRIGRRIEARL